MQEATDQGVTSPKKNMHPSLQLPDTSHMYYFLLGHDTCNWNNLYLGNVMD
jgi:hypothetical protein